MVIKIANGNYQVKFRGSDGKWVTKVFHAKRDAQKFYEDYVQPDLGSRPSGARSIWVFELVSKSLSSGRTWISMPEW